MNQDKESKNEKQPLVSVIIPCYNGEKFIGEAIESVLNQTYQNWELIIVNDGSTDHSKEIVKKYLTDNRIQYIEHRENKGIPSARNTGIKASKGEYIALLDQDDLWVPDKLQLQITAFLNEKGGNVGLIFSDLLFLQGHELNHRSWPSKKVPKNIDKKNIEEVSKILFLFNFIPAITVLIKRDCFDKLGLFDISLLGGADDYELFIRIANNCKLKYIDYPLGIRRLHENNFSKMERFFKDELIIVDKTIVKYNHLKDLKKTKLASLYYKLGRTYQNEEKFWKAKQNYIKSIKYKPLNIKYYFILLICQLGTFGNVLLNINKKIKIMLHKYLNY